jgi:outer membrane protein TolC
MRLTRGARIAAVMLATALGIRPALALDLETALAQVAAGNPTLSARAARVDAASARVRSVGAWPSPMFEVGVENVPVPSWSFDEDMMTMKTIGVQQRIPVFGANGLRRQSANEAVTAERAGLTEARYERLGAAWQAYADAYYTGDLALDTEHHGELMDRVVAAARARYASGRGRLDDVLRAEAERARMKAEAAAFRGEEMAARARLDALRGRTEGAPEPLTAPPLPTLDPDPRGWRADAGHPRIAAAEANARQYRAAASASRRSQWPDLDVRVTYGFREPLAGVMEQDDMVSAMVGMNLPLFGAARAEASELEALARASDAERREAAVGVEEEIRAAHALAIAQQRRVALLADTIVTASRKAVDAAWSAYEAGSVDLARVLESAHSLYEQDVALHRARQALSQAHARLVALTGRTDRLGITPPPGLGAPEGAAR